MAAVATVVATRAVWRRARASKTLHLDGTGRSWTAHPIVCKQGVVGSSPIVSTPKNPGGTWVFAVPGAVEVRRRAKLSEAVPVRFPEELVQEVRRRAADDDRSVSNWIRRAVEHELARDEA
jgi:hypothetical protein